MATVRPETLRRDYPTVAAQRTRRRWFPAPKKQAPWMEDPHPLMLIAKSIVLAFIVLVMLFPFVNVVASCSPPTRTSSPAA